jgi:hypothetical protein
MKIADGCTVIRGVTESALQIVYVATDLKNSSPVVIEFAKVSVEGAVFLHHKNDVVHAVLQRGIRIGRRQRKLGRAPDNSLAGGKA